MSVGTVAGNKTTKVAASVWHLRPGWIGSEFLSDGAALNLLVVRVDDTPPWNFAFLLAPMASSSPTSP